MISVNIEQIDNGFLISMFNTDGEPEADQHFFVDDFEVALANIQNWMKDATEKIESAKET